MYGMDAWRKWLGLASWQRCSLAQSRSAVCFLHVCIMPWCDNPIASQLSSARLVVCHVWQVRRLEEQPAETLNRCGSAACHGELWAMSQTPRHDISLQALNSEPGQLDGVARLILRSKAQFFWAHGDADRVLLSLQCCVAASVTTCWQHVATLLWKLDT